jgi:MHS family proline/betaine transporter-like MFS transporter
MKTRSILAGSLGNILEWYDFGLLIYLTPLFAQLFFPTTDKQAATIEVFGIFAVGFICRPIGAVLLGHLGDRIGRSKTLRLSILLITLPTVCVGLLPTYNSIGIYAPLLLLLFRLLQGLCIGGEYAGAIVYLTELATANRRAFITSLASTGSNLGILLATVVAWLVMHFLSPVQAMSFGWRIPFVVSGILGFIILYLRSYIHETAPFDHLQRMQQIARLPFLVAIHENWKVVLKIMGLVCLGASLYYTTFTYLNHYLVQNSGLSLDTALKLQSFFVTLMLILVPLAGMLCDRIGRKSMFFIFSCGVILIIVPCFYMLKTGYIPCILVAMGLLTLFSSLEQGTTGVTIVENVSLQVRYTTVAMAYNGGNAIFGGITPLFLAGLVQFTRNPLTPAYYVLVAAFVTLSVVIFGLRETRYRSLIESKEGAPDRS